MSAPATLAVEVTPFDIANGRRSDNCACAVALALKRLPGVTDAWVEFGDVTVTFGSDQRDYALPPEATRFIEDFDNGWGVEPFTFTAELL